MFLAIGIHIGDKMEAMSTATLARLVQGGYTPKISVMQLAALIATAAAVKRLLGTMPTVTDAEVAA